MQFNKIKLFTLGAILIANNQIKPVSYIKESYSTYGLMLAGVAALYAGSDKIDDYIADYCKARDYIAHDDNQFVNKSRTVLNEISYQYRDEIKGLDTSIDCLEQLFEQVIPGQGMFCDYKYIEFRASSMHELNLYVKKLKNLLLSKNFNFKFITI